MNSLHETATEISRDSNLGLEVISVRDLYYDDGADPDQQRPNNVRAGSGLCSVSHYLIGVQDDADFLVVIDTRDWSVKGHAIPAGSDEHRLYDDQDDTAEPDQKIDLEACMTCQLRGETVILAFGSGVCRQRERIVIARFKDGNLEFEELETSDFHSSLDSVLRENQAELNLEGILLKGNRLCAFSRGDHGEKPLDAILQLDWNDFLNYLESPKPTKQTPEIIEAQGYKLGQLDGVPLTFSDAEKCPRSNATLFTVSSESDEGAGRSLIGLMDERRTVIGEGQDFPLRGKIEGICYLESDPSRLFLIDDQDDHKKASRLYEVKLLGDW